MQAQTAEIRIERHFPYSVEDIFAHWISPETRTRWEAGPDTGMRYEGFDTREGGTEVVQIISDGKQVGHLTQTFTRISENELLAVVMTGAFGGITTMLTNLALEFRSSDTGCCIEGVSQVVDLTGRDIQKQHEDGWDWILQRFEEDIKKHGLITKPKDTS